MVSVVQAPTDEPASSMTPEQIKEAMKSGLFTYMPHDIPYKKIKGTNISWDMDDGLRFYRDKDDKVEYDLIINDWFNEVTLFMGKWKDQWLVMNKKHFFCVEFILGKDGKEIFKYKMDPSKCKFLITMPDGTVGDAISWLTYCIPFQERTGGEVWVQTSEFLIPVFEKANPNIHFTHIKDEKLPKMNFDAVFRAGLFFKPDPDREPISHKVAGLGGGLAYLLDVPLNSPPPKVTLPTERKIKEKYVVIAVQASAAVKMWNNPFGWDEVVKFLKEQGYRVLCIDKMKSFPGPNGFISRPPMGVEDFTGDIPLQERVNLMAHADMFIGCSSGLSWLAWCVGIPRVIISGFTDPQTEPFTPYRCISFHGCHGCWNDPNLQFDNKDYFWCPRKKEFECSKLISGKMVINKIWECIQNEGKSSIS